MKTCSIIHIRWAAQKDVPELLRLEQSGFASDRFSEDQIFYLIEEAHGATLVAECDGAVVGVLYALWRKGARNGRIYSISVDPEYRGAGIGAALLKDAELEMSWRGFTQSSLEVRVDNDRAITFYKKHGYEERARLPKYYEDDADGIRMVKALANGVEPGVKSKAPYYAQSLDFTCGPASLMMALKKYYPETELNRTLELNLWKEATLIFMTSGFGGAGPFGLAMSAVKRGLKVRVILSTDKVPFLLSVRDPKKREVIRLMHEEMYKSALASGVSISFFDFNLQDLQCALRRGFLPITLVSAYRLTGDRTPHWVVVTGFDKSNVYIHDPDEESYASDTLQARNLSISRKEFERMGRYGKDVFRCVVFVGR